MKKTCSFLIRVFLLSWLAAAVVSQAAARDLAPRGQAPAPKVEHKYEKKPVLKAVKKPVLPAYLNDDDEDEPPARRKPVKKVMHKWHKPVRKAAPAPPPAPVVQTPPPDEAQTMLSQAREKEAAGQIDEALAMLIRFINLFPRHADRAATLMHLGQLARDRGLADKALQIFSLGASLYPESKMAAEANWQAINLEFIQDLTGGDPLVSFKNFLNRVVLMNAPLDKVRDSIRLGWQAVEKAVRQKSPCPPQLVEEVLALWEAQPEGSQPPEAALFVGEMLMGNGLQATARSYLEQARDQGSPKVRAQALAGLLEAAWNSRDFQRFAQAWKLWREKPVEVTAEVRRRLEKLPLPQGFLAGGPGAGPEKQPEADVAALLFDWWSGKNRDESRQTALLASLERFLRRPLPGAMKERLQAQLAGLEEAQGNFPQAARIYQELLAGRPGRENADFYQDRLAMVRLRSQKPEEALAIYHGLSQGEDLFWQLLARTRMADVELGRLQAEPLPND